MTKKTTATSGNMFVLTEAGYNKTPERVKPERKVNTPISEIFKYKVPSYWIDNGWVIEVAEQ